MSDSRAATLLDGRIAYTQARDGHRSGLEPVLLAAAVPARPGQDVLEGGTGAGAALLCLAARVAGIRGVGLERDAGLAELARANLDANGFAGVEIAVADLLAFDAGARRFDHALANPPWHDPAGTPSPDQRRDDARRAGATPIADWIGALSRWLRPRGSLSVIMPAWRLDEALAACAARALGSIVIIPLWPKSGRAAKLAIVTSRKGGRSPLVLAPGVILHNADGSYTAAATAILRHGAGLTPTSASARNANP